jgi:hypothetical protein
LKAVEEAVECWGKSTVSISEKSLEHRVRACEEIRKAALSDYHVFLKIAVLV